MNNVPIRELTGSVPELRKGVAILCNNKNVSLILLSRYCTGNPHKK